MRNRFLGIILGTLSLVGCAHSEFNSKEQQGIDEFVKECITVKGVRDKFESEQEAKDFCRRFIEEGIRRLHKMKD